MSSPNDALFVALAALGDLLFSRGQSYSCVVAGGASLAALGVLERVTGDDEAAKWVMAVNVDPRRTETIAWVKQHVAERRSR